MAKVIARRLAVDVRAELRPRSRACRVFVHAHVAGSLAVAVVILSTDRDARAVRRQGHRPAREVVRRLTVDVRAELRPRSSACQVFVHAHVAGARAVAVVLPSPYRDTRAVR